MKKNIGLKDKYLRIALAVILIILWAFKVIASNLALVLLSVSAILIVTSLVNFCPLYWPFGLTTRRKLEV